MLSGGLTQQWPWRQSRWSQREALDRLRLCSAEFAPIDRAVRYLKNWHGLQRARQGFIQHMDDRQLIALGIVKSLRCIIETRGHITRGQDNAGKLTVASMECEQQITLFGAGWHTGRRPATLIVRHDQWHFVHSRPAQAFSHQRQSGPRRRGGTACAGQGCTAGHVDCSEFILYLYYQRSDSLTTDQIHVCMSLEVSALIGSRTYRIVTLEPHTSSELAQRDGLGRVHQQPLAG